ncbi:hypothetical protein BCY76_001385 [Nesterenkonia sp. PF2B19]|nr:hypothetical protein BCY76_001385 [Nesterenkonia sp. PF2B19]
MPRRISMRPCPPITLPMTLPIAFPARRPANPPKPIPFPPELPPHRVDGCCSAVPAGWSAHLTIAPTAARSAPTSDSTCRPRARHGPPRRRPRRPGRTWS